MLKCLRSIFSHTNVYAHAYTNSLSMRYATFNSSKLSEACMRQWFRHGLRRTEKTLTHCWSIFNTVCCMRLIYSVHPKNYASMGTDLCKYIYMGIQGTKIKCRRFGLSTFWFIDVLVCRRFGLSTVWFVDVLVCRSFGLSTFWFVDVLVYRRLGLSTFWLSTFRFVDVLTSYPTVH